MATCRLMGAIYNPTHEEAVPQQYGPILNVWEAIQAVFLPVLGHMGHFIISRRLYATASLLTGCFQATLVWFKQMVTLVEASCMT